LDYLSFELLHHRLLAGNPCAEEATNYFLSRIAATADLNAYLGVFADRALAQARAIDTKAAAGKPLGRLAGMVLSVKDLICIRGEEVNAGSHILDGFKSVYSATVIERIEAEDGIIIGRTNCDAFGMGSSNEFSDYGPVKNNIDPTKVSGGSSGGSAVSVSAGLCHVSLGSDTGGSVRQPASFCGVVGIKPTYGRISRHGLIAYASSLDQIGVLGKHISDCALVTEIIAGPDDYDSTLVQDPCPPLVPQPISSQKFKFAYYKQALHDPGLDPEIQKAFSSLLTNLEAQGHQVTLVDFPLLDYLIPTYYILTTAEASSNLSRFTGVLYGPRAEQVTDLESLYIRTRNEGFGKEVKRRIILGTYVLSSESFESYFLQATKVRQLIKVDTLALLKDYDFIISPTSPTVAFGLGERTKQDPTAMYLADIYTVQPNLVGTSAISVPLFHNTAGMPFGVQLIGRPFMEQELFSGAQELLHLVGK
jgi:aspartyl-tRNA(Asn)/glutamyl-tRNA(Gln) amidotransferase subunit A